MPLFGPPNIDDLKERKDIKGLNRALSHKDENIVREASFALADFGVYASIGLLIGISDPDWKIRRTAYTCFAKFKNFGLIPLIVSLHDDNEMVRLSGLLCLMLYEDRRAIQPVSQIMLNDSSKNVRKASVLTLYKLSGEKALDQFLVARNDADEEVKKTVNEVLGKMGY